MRDGKDSDRETKVGPELAEGDMNAKEHSEAQSERAREPATEVGPELAEGDMNAEEHSEAQSERARERATREESLWQTIKGDFSQATGLRLLGVILMLTWMAFQWGWGNDILSLIHI